MADRRLALGKRNDVTEHSVEAYNSRCGICGCLCSCGGGNSGMQMAWHGGQLTSFSEVHFEPDPNRPIGR